MTATPRDVDARGAHATAIARRENLSVRLVDALVDRRQTAASPVLPSAASVKAALSDEARLVREDKLRDELKTLARQQPPRAGQPPTVAPLRQRPPRHRHPERLHRPPRRIQKTGQPPYVHPPALPPPCATTGN